MKQYEKKSQISNDLFEHLKHIIASLEAELNIIDTNRSKQTHLTTIPPQTWHSKFVPLKTYSNAEQQTQIPSENIALAKTLKDHELTAINLINESSDRANQIKAKITQFRSVHRYSR